VSLKFFLARAQASTNACAEGLDLTLMEGMVGHGKKEEEKKRREEKKEIRRNKTIGKCVR